MSDRRSERYDSSDSSSSQLWSQDHFADHVLNVLSAHIAIIERDGKIVHTNTAWRKFAQGNGMEKRFDAVGINYLEICRAVDGEDAPVARQAADGIRAVIAAESDEFLMEYPCHSPERKHWFHMRVTRFERENCIYGVISHENVTDLKSTQEELETKRVELTEHARELEEANIALKVLLKQREMDRQELEQSVLSNVHQRIFPYLEKLKRKRSGEEQLNLLTLLESSLIEITSPFVKKLTVEHTGLTPREIQVANLVRDGHSTKEVAAFLNLSVRAIEFHRENIRKKLGLTDRKANLRSHLLVLNGNQMNDLEEADDA